MTRQKAVLLGSAGAFALSLGLTAAPAAAFDDVKWTWYKKVFERVKVDVDVDVKLDPEGLTQVEKLQIHIGDAKAYSHVWNIRNNPGKDGHHDPKDPKKDFYDNKKDFRYDKKHKFDKPLDAEVELPAVESVATAIGNNQTIESSVATMLHDGQFLFDVKDRSYPDAIDAYMASDAYDGKDGKDGKKHGGNTHTDLALTVALGAALGILDKSEISATSTVHDILNATVESTATAVGNNMNVDLSTAEGDDRLLIADITQVAVADVYANSSVHNVSINNYKNLGAVSPIVSSTATAIGNNLSINVGVPDTNTE